MYVYTCTYFSILEIMKPPLEGSKQKENIPGAFFADADTPVQLRLTVCVLSLSWAARYNTWLLITLTPRDVGYSFLFFSSVLDCQLCSDSYVYLAHHELESVVITTN